MKKKILQALLCISMFSVVGCTTNPYVASGAWGGVGGAALGAGTGALVGSLISAGDVGKSMLLGTAIGLPTGIIVGVGYRSYKENKVINGNNEIIEANARLLRERQIQIDKLREELVDESFRINPDSTTAEYIYTGATIGTYH